MAKYLQGKGPARSVRMGDAVAAVAAPVARVIDAVSAMAGRPTRLATCGGCAARRRMLNALGGDDARAWPPADEAGWI